MHILKKFKFEAAHRITNHDGLCDNLHGHSYKFIVCISNDMDDDEPKNSGMVMDFQKMKELLASVVVSYDHALILSSDIRDDFDEQLDKLDTKKVYITGRTTVENLAIDIYDKILNIVDPLGCSLESVELWETENNSALYKGEWSY